MSSPEEQMFEMERGHQIWAARNAKTSLDQLNEAIDRAIKAGAIVTMIDHEGIRRNVSKIEVAVWTPLI